MKPGRIAVLSLSLSAAGFAGLVGYEGYTNHAIQPVKNDRWTYGFGSTVRPDGAPVQPGDTITPPAAVRLAVAHVGKDEPLLRRCFAGAEFHPWEWDAVVTLAYNVGPGAVCRSSMPGKAQRTEYAAMCRTILDFRKVQGRDCSLPENARFCGGVWTARQAGYRLCTEGYPQ